MGIDAGFDMVPRLTRGTDDRHDWQRFIDAVIDHYKTDTRMEANPHYIAFKVGEYPMLPFEGHKFLRFSSKISGSCAPADSYIDTVTRIAQAHFGSRIQHWNECMDQYGEYGWNEVNESIRSYEQADETEVHTGVTSSTAGRRLFLVSDNPLFEVSDIAGKGRGIVARLDISVGTRILCEKPLMTMRPMPLGELERNLATKLKAMPRVSQRQFLALHNNCPGRYPFSHTFKTNALPCGPGSSTGAVYPTICLLNHSCIPNSHHSWNSMREEETIHAIHPIAAGDEITIAYHQDGTHDARRKFLKESFGFICDCLKCSRPPPELQASDNRRVLIQSLDESIGNPFRLQATPQQSLRDCYSLLKVLEDEYEGYPGVLLARLYYDAFQICIAHGDQARASLFAERSHAARVVCEGEDSPETMRMLSLSRKPSAHASLQLCSTKWKTRKKMVPKGLDSTSLEKWLFRKSM